VGSSGSENSLRSLSRSWSRVGAAGRWSGSGKSENLIGFSGHREAAEFGHIHPDHHVARANLGIIENLRNVVDRAARDSCSAEDFEPVRGVARGKGTLDFGRELPMVPSAFFVADETGIGAQILTSQRLAEFREERVVSRRDHDIPVSGGKAVEGGDRRVARAGGPRDFAGSLMTGNRVLEDRDLAIEHCDVNLLRLAAPLAVTQRGVDPDTGEEPRRDVTDRSPDPRRMRSGLSGQTHDAPHRLNDQVIGRPRSIGSRVAKPGDGRVDQSRMAGVEGLPAVAEFLHRARAEILDQNVGFFQESFEERAVVLILQIEGDALLAAVQRDEVGGGARDEGSNVPGVVTAIRALDFDHPGPQIAEHHGAVRAGEHACEIEHGNAVEGTSRGVESVLRHWAIISLERVVSLGRVVSHERVISRQRVVSHEPVNR